ncbi:MAG: nucleoside-diphosphate kinase [Deltaproteobacteria bacterium]|nr:MAG: nucleoside-diphosphate kinase [Deltaproteobacteria bacterium]
MQERTLLIVKPDAVKKNVSGEILRRGESAGLKIVAAKMIALSKAQAQGFYAVHKERPFFDSLATFMSSGPVLVAVLEGADAIQANRRLMGATDPAKADAGTIRRDFGTNVEQNAVHGSDGPDTARWEIGYFFGELEIQAR